MKQEGLIYVLAAALCLGWLLSPPRTHAARGHNLSINSNSSVATCADLRPTSSDGEIAQVNETFTLSKGEAPILEMNSADRGQIRVRAWNHADYSIEVCKIAVADNRGAADQMVRAVTVSHTAGNVSFNGPATDSGDWTVVFLVQAPSDAVLNLESKNGPIEVRGINGSVKVRATNGPVAVSDCGGFVDAQTKNGPIAFSGDRGDVRLHAENGPIAVRFAAETWNGPQLEARTVNGPLAVNVPENFRSGVRLETSGHAPMACNSPLCRNAWTDRSQGNRTMQMNGASDTIRLSTENGPVAVNSGDGKKKAQ
jgi:DUF4097 and DUF4098 domain-containing protein YvlB